MLKDRDGMLSSQKRDLFCECTECIFGHTGKMMRMCNGDNDSSKRDAYRAMLAQPEQPSRLMVPEEEAPTHADIMRGMKTKEERAAYRASLAGG